MKTKTKGLEPIVAAVLLIVVAVIGAVLVYLWFAGYVTKATSQAEQMAASEKLKIEAASLPATTDPTATVYVRNLGGVQVQIVTAYLFPVGSSAPLCDPVNPGVTINPGELKTFGITFSGCTTTSGYDYVIKLVTAKGTEIATTVTAS
ncbi:flagellar biosynthesis protein FlaG [Pyrobaculum sp. 3827-6]|uniref:archaellin/type IV pilin N-terminal domain-containing protein n=1 Tax=Pyrobaculum sp. 3827-6 TaxID=2983604 RepID=UPI0021DB4BD4|nr:archaellin/type IV pilin N-terminal domain-containing protein [Pyrobaculum sp. 3827-6]MCU7787680.1 flagellar biosynthesis protein FlaG [Pyrobaculum sp. 3827-6]